MIETKVAFSVGDFIVDFENIYKIVNKKDQSDLSGKTVTYFFYEPINKSNNQATYSTPINNLKSSGFRSPIDSDAVKDLYKEAKTKIDPNAVLDFRSIKESLYENNPHKNLSILKQLFLMKKNNVGKFSRTNQDVLDTILKHLTDEIAFVTQETVSQVEEKLVSLIEKSI